MALNVAAGTKSPRKKKVENRAKKGSSAPNRNGKAKKTKRQAITEATALNPPFDPRMRRIGSPLNRTAAIKRGWIQDEQAAKRVNFLFNPSQLDLSHAINPEAVATYKQQRPVDVMDPYYTSTGSSTSLKLLYDRTYELFSAPGTGQGKNLANRYGVYADVAAWYVFLGMLEEMPETWEDTLMEQPAQLKAAYLFVGPKLVYFGWVSGISVTYSHWTQNMIPSRCAVDVSFTILPHVGKSPRRPGDPLNTSGWGDYTDLAREGKGPLVR